MPNFEPEDFRVLELNFNAHTQGSGYNPGDGEGTSQPKGPGVTIPMNIEGVERGEGEREEQRGEEHQLHRTVPEGEDLGGQEEEMNSPPLTPGHDSNSDDPDLVTLHRVVASLRTKLATQRMEARAAAPSHIKELQRKLQEEKDRCSKLERDKKDIIDTCVHAESRASFFAMENEQLKVISEANSEALKNSREECARLTEELTKSRTDLM